MRGKPKKNDLCFLLINLLDSAKFGKICTHKYWWLENILGVRGSRLLSTRVETSSILLVVRFVPIEATIPRTLDQYLVNSLGDHDEVL